MSSLNKFRTSAEVTVDSNNADEWANIIGKPLAEELKKPPAPPKSIIVAAVNQSTGTITFKSKNEGDK